MKLIFFDASATANLVMLILFWFVIFFAFAFVAGGITLIFIIGDDIGYVEAFRRVYVDIW